MCIRDSNNTAYYIKNGIVHLSLGHEQGKKSLNMFGPGTIFPVGVEIHEFRVEYEMIIQAPVSYTHLAIENRNTLNPISASMAISSL